MESLEAMKFKKTGFTLVELLVVFSIIMLLVSIMLPALNKARVYGRQMLVIDNQKEITVGAT